jgi:hypothetical protein
MPAFDWNMLIPFAPLHWTTIFHYIILLGTLFILVASQSNVGIIYIFFLAALAVVTGADLYSNVIPGLPRFVIFMFRVGMVGIPFIISGLAPVEDLRMVAIILGFLGFVIFSMTFLSCAIPALADPRILSWCP